ncbi:MAG: Fic family protein [Acidobacteriota bacterium]|nr:Fic family protein [Acidobacteriota bacterium]
MDVLATAGQLKNELDALRPLNAEAEARIMQKFRLDWNYHSNNLEGNSLTYGETKALILFGITAQGKPLKDHFEITGHNEAINWIIEMIKGETDLSEVFIRQLHQLLLKESYEVEAQTQNGKSTKRKIEVGKYKIMSNHVLTQTGETFYFATPEETPAKMQELIEWLRNEKENSDVNPIILAALFHYKFISIHPFDDGNGRVARILMNFILMQYGFPPVIIKTNDKENYFSVLQQADAGIFEPFIEYIADNLIRSLEIMIKGARGESIEEPDDLDKQLSLFEASFTEKFKKVDVIKTKENFKGIFNNSIIPLAGALIKNWKKFDRFYLESEFNIKIETRYGVKNEHLSYENFEADSINSLKILLKDFDKKEKADSRLEINVTHIHFSYHHKLFNRSHYNEFSYASTITVRLAKTEYIISSLKPKFKHHKSYSENLTEFEIEQIAKTIALHHFEYLEAKRKKIEEGTKKN